LPSSIIKTTLERASERSNQQFKPRVERPSILTPYTRRLILRLVRAIPKIKYSEICTQTQLEVSKSTFYRLLKKEGIKNWIAKVRSFLSPESAAKRFQWGKDHENWIQDQWKLIIFSDKLSVERGRGAALYWVFQTPDQKWDKDFITIKNCGKDISVMVWSAIWVGERSDIVIMDRDEESKRGGYSANSYIQVLDAQILTIYKPEIIFMQDNAPIHTTGKVKQ
jgi:hypothetical protein